MPNYTPNPAAIHGNAPAPTQQAPAARKEHAFIRNDDRDINARYYSYAKRVPPEATKKFNNGRFSGTDINPMWRIQKLTEMFGPCGIGWYIDVIDKKMERIDDQTIMSTVDINLYINENGEWSKPIYGTGGNMFMVKGRIDDDGWKKAYTDAIGVACKALGIGADVWFENDRTKYDVYVLPDDVKPAGKPAPKPAEKPAEKPVAKPVREKPQEKAPTAAQEAVQASTQENTQGTVQENTQESIQENAPLDLPWEENGEFPEAPEEVSQELLTAMVSGVVKSIPLDQKRMVANAIKKYADGSADYRHVSDPEMRKNVYMAVMELKSTLTPNK